MTESPLRPKRFPLQRVLLLAIAGVGLMLAFLVISSSGLSDSAARWESGARRLGLHCQSAWMEAFPNLNRLGAQLGIRLPSFMRPVMVVRTYRKEDTEKLLWLGRCPVRLMVHTNNVISPEKMQQLRDEIGAEMAK